MPDENKIVPFDEALKSLAQRQALPTNLSSADLRALGARFHENNLVSARNNIAGIMDDFKAAIEKILNPKTEQRADRITPENPQGNVSTGLDPATARLQVKQLLQERGYSPAAGERGTIKDLSSDARIKLFLDTNVELSQGRGWFIQAQDPAVLDAFPAQELFRVEARKKIRDWGVRWLAAARLVGDTDALRVFGETGRMIARKDSPIWAALGEGAGGFEEDALGNPFPPFAFNSGMGVRDVPYRLAVSLGVVGPGQKIQPQPIDFGNLFQKAA